MSTYRQRLLHDLSTFVTVLRGEARIDSSHTMPGSFSLVTEDVEKCAPTGVHDALREMVIFHHVRDLKVFNDNELIALGIRFRGLEMVIAALATFLATFRRRCEPFLRRHMARCLRLSVR